MEQLIYEKIRDQNPNKVRFIRLGKKGDVFNECKQGKKAYFGFGSERIIDKCNILKENLSSSELLREHIRCNLSINNSSQISNIMRQYENFFSDSGDTLWLTEYNRTVYFGYFANADAYVDDNRTFRNMEFGWVSDDKLGNIITRSQLSGSISKTFSYQSTICKFSPQSARLIINKILCEINEQKKNILNTLQDLQSQLQNMLALFSPQDMELLIELIISRSGLKRVGAAGKAEEFLDAEFMHPITHDHYYVQVKSKTSEGEFKAYCGKLAEIQQRKPNLKMIYAYHTGDIGSLSASGVEVWNKERIAELALEYGLARWVCETAPV